MMTPRFEPSLFRLIYISRNRLKTDLDQAVGHILATSRRNNGQAGVTGALMFNRSLFVQVLEGGQDAVETTFERIQLDERHGTVSLLSVDHVGSRLFHGWAMAFVGSGNSPVCAELDADFDPARLTGDGVLTLLHERLRQESF